MDEEISLENNNFISNNNNINNNNDFSISISTSNIVNQDRKSSFSKSPGYSPLRTSTNVRMNTKSFHLHNTNIHHMTPNLFSPPQKITTDTNINNNKTKKLNSQSNYFLKSPPINNNTTSNNINSNKTTNNSNNNNINNSNSNNNNNKLKPIIKTAPNETRKFDFIYSPRTTFINKKKKEEKFFLDLGVSFDPISIKIIKSYFKERLGVLTENEFINIIKNNLFSWHPELPPEERNDLMIKLLHKLYQEIDLNNKNDIDWDEFTNYIIYSGNHIFEERSNYHLKYYAPSKKSIDQNELTDIITHAFYIEKYNLIGIVIEGKSQIIFYDADTCKKLKAKIDIRETQRHIDKIEFNLLEEKANKTLIKKEIEKMIQMKIHEEYTKKRFAHLAKSLGKVTIKKFNDLYTSTDSKNNTIQEIKEEEENNKNIKFNKNNKNKNGKNKNTITNIKTRNSNNSKEAKSVEKKYLETIRKNNKINNFDNETKKDSATKALSLALLSNTSRYSDNNNNTSQFKLNYKIKDFNKKLTILCTCFVDEYDVLFVSSSNNIISAWKYFEADFKNVNKLGDFIIDKSDFSCAIFTSNLPQYTMDWEPMQKNLYSGQTDGKILIWNMAKNSYSAAMDFKKAKAVNDLNSNNKNNYNEQKQNFNESVINSNNNSSSNTSNSVSNKNRRFGGGNDLKNNAFNINRDGKQSTKLSLNEKLLSNLKNDMVREGVSCIKVLGKMQMIAAGYYNGYVIIWDTMLKEQRKIYNDQTTGIYQIVFDSQRKLIFTCGFDHDIFIYDPYIDGSAVHRLTGHNWSINSIACNEKTNEFISIDIYGNIKIWDLDNYYNFQTINLNETVTKTNLVQNQHLKKISSNQKMILLAKVNKIFTFGEKLMMFNIESSSLPDLCDNQVILGCAYLKNKYQLATICLKKIKFWNIFNGKITKIYDNFLSSNLCEITSFCTDNAQKRIYLGDSLGHLKCMNLNTGKILKQFIPHNREVISLCHSDKYDILISLSMDNIIKLHEDKQITKTCLIKELNMDIFVVTSITYMENTSRLILGSNQGDVRFFDIDHLRHDSYGEEFQPGKNNYNGDSICKIFAFENYPLCLCCHESGRAKFVITPPNKYRNNIFWEFHNTFCKEKIIEDNENDNDSFKNKENDDNQNEDNDNLNNANFKKNNFINDKFDKRNSQEFIDSNNNNNNNKEIKEGNYIENHNDNSNINNTNININTSEMNQNQKSFHISKKEVPSKILSCCYCNESKNLFTGDLYGFIHCYSLKKVLQIFSKDPFTSTEMSSLLSLPSPTPLFIFEAHKECIKELLFPEIFPRIIITTGNDRRVKLFSPDKGDFIDELNQTSEKLQALPVGIKYYLTDPFVSKREIEKTQRGGYVYRSDLDRNKINETKRVLKKMRNENRAILDYCDKLTELNALEKLFFLTKKTDLPLDKSTYWKFVPDIDFIKNNEKKILEKITADVEELDKKNIFKNFEPISSKNYRPFFIKEMTEEQIKEFSENLNNKVRKVKLATSKILMDASNYENFEKEKKKQLRKINYETEINFLYGENYRKKFDSEKMQTMDKQRALIFGINKKNFKTVNDWFNNYYQDFQKNLEDLEKSMETKLTVKKGILGGGYNNTLNNTSNISCFTSTNSFRNKSLFTNTYSNINTNSINNNNNNNNGLPMITKGNINNNTGYVSSSTNMTNVNKKIMNTTTMSQSGKDAKKRFNKIGLKNIKLKEDSKEKNKHCINLQKKKNKAPFLTNNNGRAKSYDKTSLESKVKG